MNHPTSPAVLTPTSPLVGLVRPVRAVQTMDLVVAKFQTMMNRQTPRSQFSAGTPFKWFGYVLFGVYILQEQPQKLYKSSNLDLG